MSERLLFSGQAVRAEMIVIILEKWELHPSLVETTPAPDPDDLERDTRVLIPEAEFDRARDVLWGESEIEQAEF